MEKNKKHMIYSLTIGLIILGLSIICWLKPADSFSKEERRQLKQFPDLSVESVLNGKFMEEFESYTLDQFPFRNGLRSVKAVVQRYLLGQSDNNGIYMVDSYLSEIDAEISKAALERSIKKLNSVYNTYIKDSDAKVYLSIIPDKNYFLAEENGYLSYDYDELYEYMTSNLSYMDYIEIRDLLSIEDYYRTDTHWKQENILDIAERLKEQMKTTSVNGIENGVYIPYEKVTYETITLDTPFYGVYFGQAALPIEPDTLSYLNNGMLDACVVYDHENKRSIPVYDLQKSTGRDGYEMYLSGSISVITIDNPNALTEKELVIFRDSFGSSIAPLLVEDYAKITLLDIRYLNETMIGEYVDFSNQDVLFLYSTSVLNNESSFR